MLNDQVYCLLMHLGALNCASDDDGGVEAAALRGVLLLHSLQRFRFRSRFMFGFHGWGMRDGE
jgi:hypothetical protein